MKTFNISVQEFSRPSPRRGSIGPSSVYSTSTEEGTRLHQKLQEERQREIPDYRVEVAIEASFKRDDIQFDVSGRMDGLFISDTVLIEEIKSSFNIFDTAKKIHEQRFDHPYYLQLLTYGYFYYLKYDFKPDLGFLLVSSRNGEVMEVSVSWRIEEYEIWLEKRLNELVGEVREEERRSKRRLKFARDLSFPFERPRSGQRELIDFITEGFKAKKRLILQAPTGLGKTVGVLYPALKEALSRGQKVIYLTPKNSQQAEAQKAVELFQEKGTPLKSLTITAKNKICFKAEPLCHPDYCEFAKDHYDKLLTFDLKNELKKKRKLSSKVFKNMGEQYEVCPYELQFEAMKEAEVVICDYNYVFARESSLERLGMGEFFTKGKANLVIDEAHNLPSRLMSIFSSELSTQFLEKLQKQFDLLPRPFKRRGTELLSECLRCLRASVSKEKGAREVLPDWDEFLQINEELKEFLTDYLNSDTEIESGDPVLKLVFYWGDFTDRLLFTQEENSAFFILGLNEMGGQKLKITCCDASEKIKERYDLFEQLVAFSATLRPFEYFSQLTGLDKNQTLEKEFSTPFDKEKRKILIIPQISTKFSAREKNYPRIAQTMEKIIELRRGNYLAFFPSFEFMEQVFQLFIPPPGFKVLKQHRYMRMDETEIILNLLESKKSPIILFAVQGGVFSEGVDYSGEMIIGAFVVGPPLPNFDFERERMKAYYQEKYQNGFDYAYTYPAMAKAVQAAGRVIRTETDRGIIILMDERFVETSYAKTFPKDWCEDNPRELVSTKILSDLRDFWGQTDNFFLEDKNTISTEL